MAIVRFPKPFREPPPPTERDQFELFDDLPVLLGPEGPLSKRRMQKLVAAMATDLNELSDFVDDVREGVALLQEYLGEHEPWAS